MRRNAVLVVLVLIGACNSSVCLRKSDCPSRADASATADAAIDAPVDAVRDATPDSSSDAPDGGM